MTAGSRYPRGVDVAIVGSGPAGAAYARILSERAPGATIGMFEAGPLLTSRPGDHIESVPDGPARARALAQLSGAVAVSRGDRSARSGTAPLETACGENPQLPAAATSTNVGGMGVHWTCACPRPRGSERMKFVPDLDALLDEGERLLEVVADPMPDPSPAVRHVREVLSLGALRTGHVLGMPLAVRRNTAGRWQRAGTSTILGQVTIGNPSFRLFDCSPVTAVLRDRGGRATGVTVHDRGSGEVQDVAASVVVVAADALRTPQLLHASGIRPRALGRYLNDQAQIVHGSAVPGHLLPRSGGSTIGATDDVTHSVSWVPFDDDEHPFHGQVMHLDHAPGPDGAPVPGALRVPESIAGLAWFCPKEPRPEDCIAFMDRPDRTGLPLPVVRHTRTDADRATISRGVELVRYLADSVGEPVMPNPLVLPPGSSLHYQGTMRMGIDDDGTSVCSPDGEVWGTPGLFAGGNGVIATSTCANPTLTSVALAVRGADNVIDRLCRGC